MKATLMLSHRELIYSPHPLLRPMDEFVKLHNIRENYSEPTSSRKFCHHRRRSEPIDCHAAPCVAPPQGTIPKVDTFSSRQCTEAASNFLLLSRRVRRCKTPFWDSFSFRGSSAEAPPVVLACIV